MKPTHTGHQASPPEHSAGRRSQLEADIWAWLEGVADPEIPVISVVDLGIVRAVRVGAAGVTDDEVLEPVHCTIVITPTYSGCPAMKVIAADIIAVLHQHGVSPVTIETALSPAWSTDWMSEKGRQQLKDYRIAPPAQRVIDISGISRTRVISPAVICPHCGSASTLCVSEFGSTSCKSLYKCKDCLEPFDYFKAH